MRRIPSLLAFGKVDGLMELLGSLIDERPEFTCDTGLYPLVGAMCEGLAIPNLVDEAVEPRHPKAKLSFGVLVKALVMNILDRRTPLVHVENSYAHLDCEVLFGPGVTASDLNDDRLGDTLEALSEIDLRQLYSRIALRALDIHGIPVNSAHVDTTAASVYGAYDSPALEDFDVNRGRPKNKRTDLKQLKVGASVQQNGIPFLGEGLAGKASDSLWFRDAMDELAKLFAGDLETRPIGVFDAAASNTAMFDRAYVQKMPIITRLSDRFALAGECIRTAWQEQRWIDVGTLVAEPAKKKDAAVYRMAPFDVQLGESDWRLIVVHSSSLEAAKSSTSARNLPKRQETLVKKSAKLAKVAFASNDEAEQAIEQFRKESIGWQNPFVCSSNVEVKVVEKYTKPGKPAKDAQKTVSTKYHALVTIEGIDEKLYQEWLQQESCFVLVSNVPEHRLDDIGLLRQYKEQWVVEDTFRFLKQPIILGPICLKDKGRIKALIFVLLLAVLVAAYLRHRLLQSLAQANQPSESTNPEPTTEANLPQAESISSAEEIPVNKPEQILPQPTPNPAMLKEQQLEKQTERRLEKIITVDGRLVDRPTFKVIRDLLLPLKTITYKEGGRWKRKFIHGTPQRLLKLIQAMGFSPMIYLEPFEPDMDLWNYLPPKTRL